MKWVTYQRRRAERTGVLSGDVIHAVPPGVTLLELDRARRRRAAAAGEEALRLSVDGASGRRDVDGADPASAVDP